MKNLKSILITSLVSCFCFFGLHAQNDRVAFSPEQQELRNNLKKIRKQNKQLFLQVLNQEQKSVFQDPNLNHKEKRKIIKKSLTKEQQKVLKPSRIAMHDARKKFRESLSEEQKNNMKSLKHDMHHGHHSKNGKFSNLENLTDAQKNMLERNKEIIQANRKSFRKTFNAQQRLILKDSTLDHREKKEALRLTFSQEQEEQLISNEKEMKKLRKAFFETLTDDQKKFLNGK